MLEGSEVCTEICTWIWTSVSHSLLRCLSCFCWSWRCDSRMRYQHQHSWSSASLSLTGFVLLRMVRSQPQPLHQCHTCHQMVHSQVQVHSHCLQRCLQAWVILMKVPRPGLGTSYMNQSDPEVSSPEQPRRWSWPSSLSQSPEPPSAASSRLSSCHWFPSWCTNPPGTSCQTISWDSSCCTSHRRNLSDRNIVCEEQWWTVCPNTCRGHHSHHHQHTPHDTDTARHSGEDCTDTCLPRLDHDQSRSGDQCLWEGECPHQRRTRTDTCCPTHWLVSPVWWSSRYTWDPWAEIPGNIEHWNKNTISPEQGSEVSLTQYKTNLASILYAMILNDSQEGQLRLPNILALLKANILLLLQAINNVSLI